MADIKTRDVTRGTIRTLDRAASSLHRMKEETIRSKAEEIGSRNDSESTDPYASETVERYAVNSAAYAAKAGAEMIRQSKERPTRQNTPDIKSEYVRSTIHDTQYVHDNESQIQGQLMSLAKLSGSRVSETYTPASKKPGYLITRRVEGLPVIAVPKYWKKPQEKGP